jgi:hypothetical protein
MVGGPARDLVLWWPFWQGKEWARFRSRDSASPHLHIIIIPSSVFFLLSLISIMQPSFSSTFLGVCFFFLRGATQTAGRAKRAQGRPLCGHGVCVHATSADFHVPVVSGCPHIVPRLVGLLLLPVLNNHVPCAHKLVIICSSFRDTVYRHIWVACTNCELA